MLAIIRRAASKTLQIAGAKFEITYIGTQGLLTVLVDYRVTDESWIGPWAFEGPYRPSTFFKALARPLKTS